MIYVIPILLLLIVIAGFLVYTSIKKNTILKKDIADTQKLLLEEIDLRKRIEEANKTYVQKLATLSKGTDADRFAAASSIMSNGSVPSPKPATKP